MPPKTKISNEADLYDETLRCIRLVLLSSTKKEIVKAFTRLECILSAKCICSFCDGTNNIDFVYEFFRCLISTRTMQLIKERHLPTSRWEYIGPIYSRMYNILYDDLNPSNTKVFSNGEMEDIVCKFKMPKSLHIDTLNKIKVEREQRKRRSKKA